MPSCVALVTAKLVPAELALTELAAALDLAISPVLGLVLSLVWSLVLLYPCSGYWR